VRFVVVLVAAALSASAQSANWKPLEFLLGKWTGAAGAEDTPHGAGQGAFSFDLDLNQRIIIRRNNASYDSGTPHDDLMVIYTEGSTRAIYFDSEGHVIRYHVTVPEANRAVFESEGTQAGPKYRLTYWLERGSLRGQFEIAEPGGEFKKYLSWSSKRN